MDDLTLSLLVKAKYSGSISEVSSYSSLAIQTVAVIIGGIVLWRISVVMHKRKLAKRSRNDYFETPYSIGWKSRRK